MGKMKALVIPAHRSLEKVCSAECRNFLEEHFDVVYHDSDTEMTPEELGEKIEDVEVLLTSWGSPSLSEENLKKAKKLRYIGHAAGSVKNRIPDETFSRGIRVFSGARRIARSVAEYCMAAMFAARRDLKNCDALVRAGKWAEKKTTCVGHEITGEKIGIISASSTAREFLKMLVPFECNIKIYDPYLSAEEAQALGAQKASLEEVMSCTIVSNHAPVLEETKGMITKELFAKIPDGGLFINSARAVLIDSDALYKELEAGRFTAVLDVFDSEPLAGEELERLRRLPNVWLSSHIAGATYEDWQSLLYCVAHDIILAESGKPTAYEIRAEQWDILA